jgi:hypothetical protein
LPPIAELQPFFRTVRKNVQTLLIGAIPTYHLVLNRARWFAPSLNRALLNPLIKARHHNLGDAYCLTKL